MEVPQVDRELTSKEEIAWDPGETHLMGQAMVAFRGSWAQTQVLLGEIARK